MRFKPEFPAVTLDPALLAQDFAAAREAGKVRLGEHALFLTKFSGASWLLYDQIVRAYLRQEEVRAKMCCATANFDQFYLMLDCADGQLRRGQVPDKAAGQVCLDHIARKNPAAGIGYYQNT